jgi:hypothetical protein
MVDKRSVSQINFGFLPQQTVDVRGGVWIVDSWRNPERQPNIDEYALRRELVRIARPWALANKDGNFVNDLEVRRVKIVVKSVDRERGVSLKQFPEIWYCKNCHKIHEAPDVKCCGSTKNKAQLHFVMYCDDTAEIRAPNIRRCNDHRESRITFPGTATGQEIKFDCPVCSRQLGKGFGFQRSSSGNQMKVTVHRAASVFTPRSVVVVNPPSPDKMREIHEAGGGPRAVEWIAGGMKEKSVSASGSNLQALRKKLEASGLSPEVIEQMIAVSGLSDEGGPPPIDLKESVKDAVEQQAISVALGFSESRVTVEELLTGVDPLSRLGQVYRVKYPTALRDAGLERVELVDTFPVLTGHFGYTRGGGEAGTSRLMAYRDQRGDYVIYGDIAQTEALYFELSPSVIAKWLEKRGHVLEKYTSDREARIAILHALNVCDEEIDPIYRDVVTLVHSYAHRLIRLTAVHAGIDANSISELLFPAHFGFFIYAAARGDFVLGGLQALFETDLHEMLSTFVEGELRCALDPGCAAEGGACVACLHIGEPSCRLFNRVLSRSVFTGPAGYFAIAASPS